MPQQRPSERRIVRRTQAGFTTIAFLFIGLLVTAAVLAALQASNGVRGHVDSDVESYRLENSAQTLVTLAADRLWEDILVAMNGESPTPSAIQTFLESRGITETAASSTAPGGLPQTQYHVNAASVDAQLPLSLLALGMGEELGLPLDQQGRRTFAGATVLGLAARRTDVSGGVMITIGARLSASGNGDPSRSMTVKESFVMAQEGFNGLEFALLANNVNCIMCHASFDNAERYYNTNAQGFGSFRGVKVGTLESLMIRAGSADSTVAGTMYTSGVLMDKNGTILPDLDGTSLTGWDLDEEGRIFQDATGAMQGTDLPVVDESTLGGSGVLPAGFPSVVPDVNGNRVVDPEEFQAVSGSAGGVLSGGIRVGVPAGESYGGTGLPTTSNVTAIDGTHQGNLLLFGTPEDPIELNGRVTVDGDVALAGVVHGSGEIIASGNVYLMGSLTYADGSVIDTETGESRRTFGVAGDGATNKLALGAGGNILLGDYLTKNGSPVTGQGDGPFNFTMSEMVIFNRMEWTRTQQTLPGQGGAMVPNPLYDPTHVPRYYTMNPGDPVFLMVMNDIYFDPSTRTWLGKEHVGGWNGLMEIQPGTPAYQAAAIKALNPRGDWLSTADLTAMWSELETWNDGEPFKIDAMLYTNNGIMSLVRKSSDYDGKLLLNGGMVAADVGVLVAGGLHVNHDRRLANALGLRSTGGSVRLQRVLVH